MRDSEMCSRAGEERLLKYLKILLVSPGVANVHSGHPALAHALSGKTKLQMASRYLPIILCGVSSPGSWSSDYFPGQQRPLGQQFLDTECWLGVTSINHS